MCPLFAFLDNPMMLLMLGVLAVLLFGERLPEVAQRFGRGMAEFKKGIHGIQQDIQGAIDSATTADAAPSTPTRLDAPSEDREEPTAPKFEPPPSP
ncbi:MAG: twin-arginine translocase TatA/TatE family subunit [Planctomycetaceae bacterium]|nr:twin-arginine translocase TatA/TatE family subunit [Planctomycetaceae bacterium]